MLTAVQTQQSGVRHDIKRPRQTLPVYPSLPWRRFLASRGTTRSWHLFLSIQCFAKWLTIQWIWGGRIASCWGSSNILSVVFMHLSMWGHAMMSGVNWGYEGISEHCWWCIIPEPSHIKGEPPPLDLLSVCHFHEASLPVWTVRHGSRTEPSLFEVLTAKAEVFK